MRWRIRLHHEHGTHDIPNVIEGDTVNVPEGIAIKAVTVEPEPDTTIVPPTEVPGGPPEPTFEEPEPTMEPDTIPGPDGEPIVVQEGAGSGVMPTPEPEPSLTEAPESFLPGA